MVISLVILAISSSFAVKSVEKIIEITGLGELSVGFILLAILTSTPEILVALFSVNEGAAGFSIGNILGSNIFNIAGIVGILGVLGFLKLCCTNLLLDLSDMVFITSAIPLILVIFGVLSPVIGVILFAAFIIFNIYLYKQRTPTIESTPVLKRQAIVEGGVCQLTERKCEEKKKYTKKEITITVLILVIGFIGVVFSSEYVVISGLDIASQLGAPPILIGAKIVSIGTSLPELTTSFQAARIGRVQLAIGNILGSNLSNITLILGLTLVTTPFAADINIFTQILPFLLISTIIFWRYIARGSISRVGGGLLLGTLVLFQILVI